MASKHPDFAAEQAHIDRAYDCLDATRTAAWRMRDLTEADLGGTFQARFERNAFDEALIRRLEDLDLGDAALVFGRIDRHRVDREGVDREGVDREGVDREGAERDSAEQLGESEQPDDAFEAFHIGRLAVADQDSEPVVVDWRAPVAEPFYRATGRQPMGLARRRHLAVEGRILLDIEDELFGDGHLGVGNDDGLVGSSGLRGYSSLMASLERGRTGTLGDIVATIQGEQDEVIRSPQAGVLVVQGGPGTGKTVVALHRAAYLLYTYRFPLEDQGVLVIGPNRVFMRYIERVLPSLGEAGIDQVVLADLIPGVRFDGASSEPAAVARLKGDERMSDLIDRAIMDRERPWRDDLVVPFRSGFVRVSAAETGRIVAAAKRRFNRHNSARRWVEGELYASFAQSYRAAEVSPSEVRAEVRRDPAVREALEWMWPLLTPAELLHDLFGSMALLRLAARKVLSDAEYKLLYRARSTSVDDVGWTAADVALLDDAREALGPIPSKNGKIDSVDEIRTYGHIVIDEVQDLTPMQLKMAARRSLNGSMTVVGDIAQATGALAPRSWDDVTRFLPDKQPARVVGLSIGYRIPAPIMELATPVMNAGTPGLRAPVSVRAGQFPPRLVEVDDLLAGVVDEVAYLHGEFDLASIAIVAQDEFCPEVSAALDRAGWSHSTATSGLQQRLSVVPVGVVKGLELDAVIVVEPEMIVESTALGLRSLYVALTRPTQALSVVHRRPLPASLHEASVAVSSSR